MFNNYGLEVAILFKKAENFRKELKHPYVGSEHLLLAILNDDNEVSKYLKNYGVTFDKFRTELINVVGSATKDTDLVLYTPLLKRIIENATNDALEQNYKQVSIRHLFLALLEEGEGIAIRLLLGMGIDIDEIYEHFKISLVHKKNEKQEILEIGILLNKQVNNDEIIYGREEEISLVIETLLRKKKSNPLLIGKAGVGKTAIVEELARRINKGLVPKNLLNKRIIMLEMGSLVSGTKYRGEFEERLTKIIKELIESRDIILFIDEIHTIINAGGAEGAINASDILKPYLARGEIKVIGATTSDEYYKTIYKDKALDRRFLTIKIEEPNKEKTMAILKKIKNEYERHYQIEITDENIKDMVEFADKYITNKNNPDKTIDLLDMVCSNKKIKELDYENLSKLTKEKQIIAKEKEEFVKNGDFEKASLWKSKEQELSLKISSFLDEKRQILTYQDILEVIAKKANVPILEDKKEVFNKIKNALKDIISQDKAISLILKNIWLKLNKMNKPLSLLLVGPSGVGKTETVKKVASSIPNSKFIRLDMSEYNLDTAINKLIGVSAGYVGYDDGYIFREVIDNPYAIILVDEIEKAHPRVLNLFLQIMDEGFVHDAKGEKINFNNTMIFMTSNVVNEKSVGFTAGKKNNLQEYFTKEFMGRFTDVINYENLSEEVLIDYVKERLENKKIKPEEIIKEANCLEYGMRNLNNLINKYNNEIDIEIRI